MRKIIALGSAIFSLLGNLSSDLRAGENEYDEQIISVTHKIYWGQMCGTGFLLCRPTKNTNFVQAILVTANHVLTDFPSTNAILVLRDLDGDMFKRQDFEFPIRRNGTNLWVSHPAADVAVLPIALPTNNTVTTFLPIDALANDDYLKEQKFHPGDELRVLGYPYAYEANEAGFPILRSGRISSFPLTPSSKLKTFLLDFPVFRGNSGGPVYWAGRRHLVDGDVTSVTSSRILGLISAEANVFETTASLDETSTKRHALGIGIVVHASKIRETIDLLPAVPDP